MDSPGHTVTVIIASSARVPAAELSQCRDLTMVRSAACGPELLSQCQRLSPCLLVADEAAFESFVPEELAQVAGFGQPIQSLIISDSDESTLYKQFLRYRCSGFLASDASAAELVTAIRAILSGELWLPRRILSHAVRDLAPAAGVNRLTSRQTEVVQLVEQGLTNRQISETLGISRETVRLHLRSVNSKVGGDVRRRGVVRADGRRESQTAQSTSGGG